jgi:hypothetical protein
VFKHARRFKWIPSNPCEDVRKPKYKVKLRAFTGIEIATLTNFADDATALLIRAAASTGLRFGELAGLEWDQVDLDAGAFQVAKQFTHSAWADLKTVNSRRRIPLHKELVKQLKIHRLKTKGPLVFPGPSGGTIDYHNWHTRVWLPLLAKTGPDEDNPKRVAINGTFHMLRHFFVTALIQSGVDMKTAQTLAGHHSAAFTLDQYADAVPQQLEDAGEKVANVLLAASGSILVAAPKKTSFTVVQLLDSEARPDGLFALRAHPFGVALRAINSAEDGRVVEPAFCLSGVRMNNAWRRWVIPPYSIRKSVARPDGFEPPTTWFEGRHSIIHKSMIRISNHCANRLIFPQDMSP